MSVDTFAGFIFLNPDRNAEPLADFLGEAAEFLAAYKCEEMVAHGLNVKETIECNWKVVMDAFQEGYHVQGVHPELVAAMDESLERYGFFGDHSIATAPFGAAHDAGVEVEIEGIRGLPATFPAVADALPRFEDLLGEHRGGSGEYTFPEGTTPRLLLQQALRETWTAKGLDVSGLTQNQLTDNQFYLLFPNFFITAGPNSALASSHTVLAEQQVHYVVKCLKRMVEDDLATMEVTQQACDAFNDMLQERMENTIWIQSGSAHGYYRHHTGKIVLAFPGPNVEYWKMLRRPEMSDYAVEPNAG